MGSLVDGAWMEEENINSSSGSFMRPESVFRHWVTADGSPGPNGEGGFTVVSATCSRRCWKEMTENGSKFQGAVQIVIRIVGSKQ